MKSGGQVSPALAIVAIVVVIAIAGAVIFKFTGNHGRVQLNDSQVQQMQQMMGQRPASVGNRGIQTSAPPGAMNATPAKK